MAKQKKTKSKKNTYTRLRNDFFKSHPNSRILIGLFIVAVAVYLGQFFRKLAFTQAVNEILIQENTLHSR